MRFRVTSITACAGGNHLHLQVQINGGAARSIVVTNEEIDAIAQDGDEDLRQRGLLRMRSAILEAGATTPVQRRNAILNRDFEI